MAKAAAAQRPGSREPLRRPASDARASTTSRRARSDRHRLKAEQSARARQRGNARQRGDASPPRDGGLRKRAGRQLCRDAHAAQATVEESPERQGPIVQRAESARTPVVYTPPSPLSELRARDHTPTCVHVTARDERIQALQALGYGDREARFLSVGKSSSIRPQTRRSTVNITNPNVGQCLASEATGRTPPVERRAARGESRVARASPEDAIPRRTSGGGL